MKPAKFRTRLAQLELSQLGLARIINVNERQVRRWAAGDAAVPQVVALLLDLMLEVYEGNHEHANQ